STSTRTGLVASLATATRPSAAVRPDFFSALEMPFLRSQSAAAWRSPPVSASAFLQSIMPAPVISRSSLTSAAETLIIASFIYLFKLVMVPRGFIPEPWPEFFREEQFLLPYKLDLRRLFRLPVHPRASAQPEPLPKHQCRSRERPADARCHQWLRERSDRSRAGWRGLHHRCPGSGN